MYTSIAEIDQVAGRKLFGNTSYLTGNLAGSIRLRQAQYGSDIDRGDIDRDAGVHRLGQQFDPDFVDEYRERALEFLEDEDTAITKEHDGEVFARNLYSNAFDFAEQLPETRRFISEAMGDWLRRYYGAHFRPVFLMVQKRTHSPVEAMEQYGRNDTETWHMDPSPAHLIRCFIALDDIGPENGPTSVLSREDTLRLLREHPYGDIRSMEDEELGDVDISRFTAETGEAAFCDVITKLHRAGNPDPGEERHYMLVTFAPASTPLPDDWLERLREYRNISHYHRYRGLLLP